MKLQKFNEHALWQKDIMEINDIFNIIRDDKEVEVHSVRSDVGMDTPNYQVKIIRSKEVFVNETRTRVRWEGVDSVLKDLPRYNFCNKSQDVVDRLRAMGHNVRIYFDFYSLDDKGGKVWNTSTEVSNPIEYAYNTDIYIIWITIDISDIPKPPPPKRWWQRG